MVRVGIDGHLCNNKLLELYKLFFIPVAGWIVRAYCIHNEKLTTENCQLKTFS